MNAVGASSPAPQGGRTGRRRLRRALLLGLVVGILAAVQWAITAGSPPEIAPTGVDGLEVPLRSPSPERFVDEVTNEWLPLRPGAEWVRSGEVDGEPVTETSTVLAERVEVAGISATQLRTVRSGAGRDGAPQVALYAEDVDGNVWLVGRVGEWSLADEGAVAGLAMPREPRRGDGHLREVVDGEVRERVTVSERGASVTTAAGRFTDLLHLVEVRTGADGDTSEADVHLAAGVGEVVRSWGGVSGAGNRLELESYRPGD